ncbi:MAG: AAA family ATPase [Pyrinomonadaceae bacterium]
MLQENNFSIEDANELIRGIEPAQPPYLLLLTGSSGCGKTYLSRELEKRLDPKGTMVFYFDSIGVPSTEEMVSRYGSGEKWQEAMTVEWVRRISAQRDKVLVILEGQYHPKFAIDACRKHGIKNYRIAVVTCAEKVWTERLKGPRDQPHLITEDMRNWAKLLLEETVRLGGSVIDTSESDLNANLKDVSILIRSLMGK